MLLLLQLHVIGDFLAAYLYWLPLMFIGTVIWLPNVDPIYVFYMLAVVYSLVLSAFMIPAQWFLKGRRLR